MKITIKNKEAIKGLTHSIVLPILLFCISAMAGAFWLIFSGAVYFFIKKNNESSKWYFFFLKGTIIILATVIAFYLMLLLASCALS
jgi:hypothetical protein